MQSNVLDTNAQTIMNTFVDFGAVVDTRKPDIVTNTLSWRQTRWEIPEIRLHEHEL